MATVCNLRFIATQILTEVIVEHRSLNAVYAKSNLFSLSENQRSLVKQYCFGTLRWFFHLRGIASKLVYKPLPQKHQDIHCLLLLGLFQLIHLKTPPYAAICETVAACQNLKKPWAKGLVNQALRKFAENADVFSLEVTKNEEERFSHPRWLIKLLKKNWPLQWQTILQANNIQAPLFLRVNQQKITRDQYLLQLQEQQIPAFGVEHFPQAIGLVSPTTTDSLPGFEQGLCSIQDLASQFVAELMDLHPHQRILDACAAPGGKTSQLLEYQPQITLIAVENDPMRMTKLISNINRLQLPKASLQLIVGDAGKPETWWDGKLFDRILLDAPCSSTGVIRRRPDIKLLRQASDIYQAAEKQLSLLTALWPLLKPSGLLLYTTCSILPEENEEVVSRFLHEFTDARSIPFTLLLGIKQKIGHQLLPTINGTDGFYYALITKLDLNP